MQRTSDNIDEFPTYTYPHCELFRQKNCREKL